MGWFVETLTSLQMDRPAPADASAAFPVHCDVPRIRTLACVTIPPYPGRKRMHDPGDAGPAGKAEEGGRSGPPSLGTSSSSAAPASGTKQTNTHQPPPSGGPRDFFRPKLSIPVVVPDKAGDDAKDIRSVLLELQRASSILAKTTALDKRKPVVRPALQPLPAIPADLAYVPYLDGQVRGSHRRPPPLPRLAATTSRPLGLLAVAIPPRPRAAQSASDVRAPAPADRPSDVQRGALAPIAPLRRAGAPFEPAAGEVVRTTEYESMRTSSIFDVRQYFWTNETHQPDPQETKLKAALAESNPPSLLEKDTDDELMLSLPPEVKSVSPPQAPGTAARPSWPIFCGAAAAPPALPAPAPAARSTVQVIPRPAKPHRPPLVPSALIRLQWRVQHTDFQDKQAKRRAVLSDLKGKRKAEDDGWAHGEMVLNDLGQVWDRDTGLERKGTAWGMDVDGDVEVEVDDGEVVERLERGEEEKKYSAERIERASGIRAAKRAGHSIGMQALEERMAFEWRGRQLGEL